MMLITTLVEPDSFVYTHVCACTGMCLLVDWEYFLYDTYICAAFFKCVAPSPPPPLPLPQVVAVVSSQVQKDGQTVNFLAQETSEVLQVYMYIVTKLQNFVVL